METCIFVVAIQSCLCDAFRSLAPSLEFCPIPKCRPIAKTTVALTPQVNYGGYCSPFDVAIVFLVSPYFVTDSAVPKEKREPTSWQCGTLEEHVPCKWESFLEKQRDIMRIEWAWVHFALPGKDGRTTTNDTFHLSENDLQLHAGILTKSFENCQCFLPKLPPISTAIFMATPMRCSVCHVRSCKLALWLFRSCQPFIACKRSKGILRWPKRTYWAPLRDDG